MTTNTNKSATAFVKALTQCPAKGFDAIVPCNDVQVEIEESNWHFEFLLSANPQLNLIYAYVPKTHSVERIGISDGVLSLNLNPKVKMSMAHLVC